MSDDQPTLTTSSQGGFNFTSTHPIGEVKFHDDQPKPAETESAPKENTPEGDSEKDPHAVALGKKGAEALAAKRAAEKEAAEVPEGDEGDEAKRKASADIEGAPPEQKKKLASDRVAEATRAAAEAKRELARERADRERLAKENSELRAKQPKPAEQEPEADGNQKPKEEDFEKYADFVEALADWKADERLRREFSARERQESVRRQATEYVQTVDTHVKTYAQRMSEAMKADAG